MKYLLIIDAEVNPGSGTLLLEVAMSLCNRRLRPGSFVWTTIDESPDVRVRVELDMEEATATELAEECRQLFGVRTLTLTRAKAPAGLVARAGLNRTPVPAVSQAGGGAPP